MLFVFRTFNVIFLSLKSIIVFWKSTETQYLNFYLIIIKNCYTNGKIYGKNHGRKWKKPFITKVEKSMVFSLSSTFLPCPVQNPIFHPNFPTLVGFEGRRVTTTLTHFHFPYHPGIGPGTPLNDNQTRKTV